ncbi:protein kinase domain-containing protein [Humisphaera borealis]|uniref:Protein kinase n=1 Tax=Humisphaera borealis TaxID=2807512 RepID=A0A7M2WR69_9BACT|nr:protein kinase [Humisphaera borealis]QOV87998.1 protein kinase [Humisphaera borealis]
MKKQFDRFTLTDQLATGPGGTLYDGDEKLHGGVTRPVRVKVLPALSKADPSGESRFVEEVRILASLASHPHVVTFYGMGLTDGVPWIAMERPAATLEQLLGQAPAASADVLRMIEQVARGVAALHALQPLRLHNRLSPTSILVFDGGRHFKVSEFGLAAPPTAEPMLSAESVRYAGPELVTSESGKPGPSTDLYALGHIAYEMALGAKLHRQQFPAVAESGGDLRSVNPAKWQAWHHSMPTVPAPAHEVVRGFPERLGQIIARLIAKPINARYASTTDLLTDLASAGESSSVDTPPMAPGPLPPTVNAPMSAPAAPRFGARPPPAAPNRPLGSVSVGLGSAPQAPSGGMQVTTGNERYFIRLRNQTSGPFDVATLQRMSRQGQFSRLHQVSIDQRTWKPAGSVEGLIG